MWTPKVPSLTDEDDDMKIHPSFDVNSTYVRWLKTTDARRFQTSSAKQYINTTWSIIKKIVKDTYEHYVSK